MRWVVATLCASYALAAQVAVLLSDARIEGIAVTLLGTAFIAHSLRRLRGWLAVIAIAGAAQGLAAIGGTTWLLFAVPVVLQAGIGALFLRSLRTGDTPIVTRIAQSARGELDPELGRYTRSVTAAWAAILLAMAVVSATLPVFSHLAWSWWANVVSYLLIGLVFLIEYAIRRIRFRDHDHPSLRDYLGIVARSSLRPT